MAACLPAAAAVIWLSGCPLDSGASEPSAAGGFIRSANGSATVWAVGDGADGGAAARRVTRLIQRSGVDRFLYLGDVYESGTASEFARNYAPTYGRLAARTAPTPGNHDWPRHREGYDPYWKKVTGRTTPSYYSFRAGGWRLISLNSESPHGSGSPQLKWLHKQLQGPGTCRLLFWHRPRFSAGKHGDQPDVQPFWDALAGHAALVVNGHDHNMQRLQPRGGTTELVVGSGGHSHYSLDRGYAGLAFHDTTHYGALRLRLRRGSAHFAFVATSGRRLDAGTVRCRQR